MRREIEWLIVQRHEIKTALFLEWTQDALETEVREWGERERLEIQRKERMAGEARQWERVWLWKGTCGILCRRSPESSEKQRMKVGITVKVDSGCMWVGRKLKEIMFGGNSMSLKLGLRSYSKSERGILEALWWNLKWLLRRMGKRTDKDKKRYSCAVLGESWLCSSLSTHLCSFFSLLKLEKANCSSNQSWGFCKNRISIGYTGNKGAGKKFW